MSIRPHPVASTAAATFLATLLLALSTGRSVAAQQVQLDDGRTLTGALRSHDDQITIATRDGDVTVAAASVLKTRSRQELSAELRRLASRHSKGAFAHLELAKVAKDYGLTGTMWRHLDASLASDDLKPSVARRIDAMLDTLEPELLSHEERVLPLDKKIRRLLRIGSAAGKRNAKAHAVEHVLAGLQNTEVSAALKKLARRAGSPNQRMLAVRALDLRAGDVADRKFVLRTAILDSNEDVRTCAAETAKGASPEVQLAAVDYLSPGLISQNPNVARRTAEAFANLGSLEAVPLLVHAGPIAAAAAGGERPGNRAFIAVTTQQSYIRDFDVEVALGSFIADPKVDVVQSGAVLDATVLASITQRVNVVRSYRRSLKKLTGSDPGANPRFWSGWFTQRFAGKLNAHSPKSPETGPRIPAEGSQ